MSTEQLQKLSTQDLPDHLLTECLARIPGRGSYYSVCAVCTKWRDVILDPLFFKVRNQLGYFKPFLFLLGRPPQQTRGEFTAELYDILSDKSHAFSCPWPHIRERKILPAGLAIYGCAVVGIEVMVIGGNFDTHFYSPLLNLWRVGPAMIEPRRDFAWGVIGSRVYVAGGLSSQNERLRTVEMYDLCLNEWAAVASMPEFRSGCKGEVVRGKLFIVGDQTTFAPHRLNPPCLLIYDPCFNMWTKGNGLPSKRWYFHTAVVGGMLCVVGGGRMPYPAPRLAQPCWASPLLYDEITNEWTEAGNLRCDSDTCRKLREQSLSLKVAVAGVGKALFMITAGNQKMMSYEVDTDVNSALPCSAVWNRQQGMTQFRRRLRYPWYGHIHSIMTVMSL